MTPTEGFASGTAVEWGNPSNRGATCPHCATFAQFNPAELVVSQAAAADDLMYALYRCQSCRLPIAVEGKVGATTTQYSVQRVYPPPTTRKGQDAEVPPSVDGALSEAIVCAAIGAPVAGAIMCRRAVELITRDKNAEGGNLRERIDALDIPTGLKEIAHGVRLLGNEAVHPEAEAWDSVTAADTALLIDLTEEIARQVYEVPARVASLRIRTGQGAPSEEGA